MPLIRFRTKSQITLPDAIVKKLHLQAGDVLDVDIVEGNIILTPKKVVDRRAR